jgi:hypothetical protein
VVFTGGGCTGVAATMAASSGEPTGVTVTAAGSGCTSAPVATAVGYGQVSALPVQGGIVNGAWSVQVPDTALTMPANVCLSVTAVDNASGAQLLAGGYNCVQPAGSGPAVTGLYAFCGSSTPPNGGTCSFDAYTPLLGALAVQQPGTPGAAGPANTLAIGTVSTLGAGASATASITGAAPAQTLNLGIPQGPVGPTGLTGGTGLTGPVGPGTTVALGTVTTLSAGSSATAAVTGTAPNYVLSLGLPTGAAGPPGGSLSYPGVISNSLDGLTMTGPLSIGESIAFPYTYINTWGDSFTAGNQDLSGTTYCGVLATLSGMTCNNYGVGGETSSGIAGRMGAVALAVVVTGNTIPASGGVVITFSPSLYAPQNASVQSTIAGVSGVTTDSAGTYYFTRSSSGSAVSVSGAGVAWTPNVVPQAGSLNIIEACTNNVNPVQPCISDVQAMVATVIAAGGQYVIIGPYEGDKPSGYFPTGSGYQAMLTIEQTEQGLFPNNFINAREQMVTQANPNSVADQIAASRDLPPPSIRAQYNLGTLTSTITSSTCTFTSTTNTNISTSNTVIFADTGEQVLVQTASGGTPLTCVRGYNQTTAAAHTSGVAMTGVDGLHPGGNGYTYLAGLIYQWMQANPANISTGVQPMVAAQAAAGTGIASIGSGQEGVAMARYNLYSPFQNTSLGNSAFGALQTGTQNVGAGYKAAFNLTTGNFNTVLGASVAGNMTTGNSNTLLGWASGFALTAQSGDTAVGANALNADTIGSQTAVGYGALHATSTGTNNSALGYKALFANTTGIQNSAFGDTALGAGTTGQQNAAFGYFASYLLTTGSYNAIFGASTGLELTTGNYNALFGWTTGGALTTQGDEAAFGAGALANDTSGSQTGVGYAALHTDVTGTQNTAVGWKALYSTTNTGNTAVGYSALTSDTSAFNNTAVGDNALGGITTGVNNTAVGYQAGYNAGTAQVTTLGSTFVGYEADDIADGYTNSNVFGYAAQGTASNQVVLGNTSVTSTLLRGTLHATGSAPTASAGTITGANAGGYVSGLSAATSVTVTFANSGWATWDACVGNASTSTLVYVSSLSLTSVTFSFSSFTGTLYYHCDGN